MINREPVLPPEFLFPIEDWRLVEKRFVPAFVAQTETLFATANGYLGLRGGFEEGAPAFLHGTFANGFHETWPIPYGEKACGFAQTGQTIVNLPDGKIIRLYVDDELLDLTRVSVLRYERALDMRWGTLDREVLWEMPSGKQVRVRSRRLVSFTERHLAAISYEVTVLNARTPVVISSELMRHRPEAVVEEDDPRRARTFIESALLPERSEARDARVMLGLVTRRSRMALACGIDHALETDCSFSAERAAADGSGRVVFSVDAEPGKPLRLTKYLTYHTSRTVDVEEQRKRAEWSLDRAVRAGFARLLADQRQFLDDFWQRSDVEVSGRYPRAQQCVRWNLFQLAQATARTDGAGVPAKGVTGQAYEGHYFWDMEMYVLPFLTYTAPHLARNLLLFRYRMLDHARRRAREVSQKGALFPWRTISGEEASAYYAAGTAQYHINAAVAYALRQYADVTGDRDFLYEYGAEILVETARLWYDLGFFSERQDGHFVIHGVTGPDEYTAVVNNNTYTNLMARENLAYAAEVVEELRALRPEQYAVLAHYTGLRPGEPDDWKRAAARMYVPYDRRLGINPQDDSFLDREVWDFANTPADRYPLLLYYHPLVIYRHQVIKQADVVLAMFLLGDEFTAEQKRRNFDYYDPLTTGDSSLSACIQSMVAAEVGYPEKAIQYLLFAVLMDLADVGGNVRDGCHVASIGGTWMALVHGLAGLRNRDGRICFNPKPNLTPLKFRLTLRGQRLGVEIEDGQVTYLLREGPDLVIRHRDEEVRLAAGVPVVRALGPAGERPAGGAGPDGSATPSGESPAGARP